MKSIKGKVFVILLLSALFLGGVGYLSLNRLFELQERISQLAAPNKKWEHFQRITTDLGKLNTVFVNQGFEDSEAFDIKYLSLVDSINLQIASLRKLYNPADDILALERIDTIPIILDQVLEEFEIVKELRTKKQDEVYLKLEEELLLKLSEVSIKDSMLVVDKISYEVRKRNVPDSIFLPKAKEDAERRNFFQRLFDRQVAKENELVIQQKEVIDDTLVVAQSDTLLLTSSKAINDEEITDIIKSAFTNYYRGEVALMERIRETERNFYSKNARITSKLELLVNELQFEESEAARYEAQRTLRFSQRFQTTIITVISFFVVLCLVLMFLTIRDINQNRKYQNQILLNEKRALREAQAKQDFLSTMSHELRTPLTSIIGYADMLSSDDENATAIRSSSRHLLQVANEILDIAKVEAGIIEIKAESFDLTEMLHDVARSFKRLILDKGINPDFDLPEYNIWVKSDPHRIRQVLYNLLHNALKFTEKGVVGMRCQVKDALNGQVSMTIEVFDSGVGIEKDQQEAIFQQYKQAGTHKSKMQGTGLGLGIVKKVVEMLSGTISVRSTLGEGATFTLALTLQKVDSLSPTRIINEGLEGLPLSGLEIYCIDDDPLIAKLYTRILSSAGANVCSETNPMKALAHLKEHVRDYHVVVTDVKMPKLNGYDLLRALEQANARPEVIIASTANVLLSENDKNELKAFDARLSKPIDTHLLIETILRFVNRNAVRLNANEPESMKGSGTTYKESEALANDSLYDLSDYEAFAMGDEAFMQEIVADLMRENEAELVLAFKKLDEKDAIGLADLIHKMSSRFAQLRVSDKADAKRIELALRAGDGLFMEARELLSHWLKVHHAMQQEFSDAGT